MRRRSWFAAFGVVLAVASAVLVGYSLTASLDTQFLASTRSGFIITDTPDDAGTWRSLQRHASTNGENIYRFEVDPTSSENARSVKPIIGNRPAFDRVFPDRRYARFAPTTVTQLHHPGGTARGEYLSTLTPNAADRVVSALRASGATVQVESTGWPALLRYIWMTSALPATAALVALASWLFGYAHATFRIRPLALVRTFGRRCPRFADAVKLGVTVALASAAAVAGTAAVLHVGTGAQQLPTFIGVSAVACVLFGATFVGGTVAGSASTPSTRYLPAYSRWRPWRRTYLASSLSMVAAIAIVSVLLDGLLGGVVASNSLDRSRSDRAQCSSCTVTIFGSTTRGSDFDAVEADYAHAARQLEREGASILAWKAGGTSGHEYNPSSVSSNAIVVNQEFLRRDQIGFRDPFAGHVRPGEWGLLIPDSSEAQTSSIQRAWLDWLSFQSSVQPGLSRPDPTPVTSRYRAREVFTYGSLGDRSALYSDAPIIVVVPAAAGLLPDSMYLAAGSSGELIFDSAEGTRRVMENSGVTTSLYVLDGLADQIARGDNQARRQLTTISVGVILGILVLGLVQALRWRSYTSLHRDRLLLEIAQGSHPLRASSLWWAGQLAIGFSAGVLLWITAQAGLQATDVTNATFIGGPIFVTAVTAGVALVGFTRRFSRKQVRAYAY